jgi:hypothetical protein
MEPDLQNIRSSRYNVSPNTGRGFFQLLLITKDGYPSFVVLKSNYVENDTDEFLFIILIIFVKISSENI